MTEFLKKKNSWRTSQESSQTRDYPEPGDSRRVLFGDFTVEGLEVFNYSSQSTLITRLKKRFLNQKV